MADIKPFVCVRPAEDVVSAVAALPYDVYNREEAKEVVARLCPSQRLSRGGDRC